MIVFYHLCLPKFANVKILEQYWRTNDFSVVFKILSINVSGFADGHLGQGLRVVA
jgi:hypothetical protein